ncbi:MAG: hypothetical protein K2L55_09545 [Muribaculaceae bacterium]|nr:hypothetical protein [Muribaculaceae bacterium]MDE6346901.1 hypothetical protein [Muribaculaceae bacterium]
MEQSNQLNENLKQIKGMLGFLNPSTSFIANAAFAVVAFVLFILQGEGISMVSLMFKYAGGILGFLVLVGLLVAAVAYPLKKNKLCTGVNYFMIGFMLLFNLLSVIPWGIITILLVILILLPWLAFTFLKKDDEIKL